MKKIVPITIEKVWGYEKWIYSPLKGRETKDQDGNITTQGPLIKIISTSHDLSLQVHPDDEMAKEIENQPNGKSESWFVLKSKSETKVGIGFKNYEPSFIRKGIQDSSIEDNINYSHVEKGDFVDIPAGGVHALGRDITVLEVQQPSDITYRYYDYNRPGLDGKLRELHIEKSIKAQKPIKFKIVKIDFSQKQTIKTLQGNQTYGSTQITIENDSVVVDINTHTAYLASAGENVYFNKYLIISLH